ncbi:hypothetical protein B0T22DRAFT_29315 [Podospora appendiculata]|uniref:Uncharacterized protein n=1 Tax=Podospora appendiculata TaxID=314037 RepID=A0AAE1CFV1_9PEZI|nr:hypothetical protein B0T22DRAFT_29315 [Podospora appendiculata]
MLPRQRISVGNMALFIPSTRDRPGLTQRDRQRLECVFFVSTGTLFTYVTPLWSTTCSCMSLCTSGSRTSKLSTEPRPSPHAGHAGILPRISLATRYLIWMNTNPQPRAPKVNRQTRGQEIPRHVQLLSLLPTLQPVDVTALVSGGHRPLRRLCISDLGCCT